MAVWVAASAGRLTIMDALTELVDAIEATPAPPCDTCNLRALCALGRLACPEFFFYVNPPDVLLPEFIKDRIPTRAIYERTYPPIDNDQQSSAYPPRRLGAEETRAIRTDARSTRDVALWYECSGSQVRAIRARFTDLST